MRAIGAVTGLGWLRDARQRRRHRQFAGPHRDARLLVIREALRAAAPGYVLLAGNSHAEMLGHPDLGGRSCVNGGIGGITADDYADALDRCVDDPAKAAVAVLFIGTNDLLRYRRPLHTEARHRFAADARRILLRLERWADCVVVAAVPPIGARNASHEAGAVAVYSESLEQLCEARGHAFIDPFDGMRAAAFPGRARSGLHEDGVHLAEYGLLARAVAALVEARADRA